MLEETSEIGQVNELEQVLQEIYRKGSRSQREIAKWVLDNPTLSLEVSLDELASITGFSRSTVLRFCRSLGADGYRDYKRLLARRFSRVATQPTNSEIIDLAFGYTEDTIRDTLINLDYQELQRAVELCTKAPYLLWFGSTESGSLAQCGAHKCSLAGMKSRVFVDYGSFMAQTSLFNKDDVLIAISWGGDGQHLREPISVALKQGLPVIAITTERFSWLAEVATVTLIAGGKFIARGGNKLSIRAGQEVLMNTLIFKTAHARGITLEWL